MILFILDPFVFKLLIHYMNSSRLIYNSSIYSTGTFNFKNTDDAVNLSVVASKLYPCYDDLLCLFVYLLLT